MRSRNGNSSSLLAICSVIYFSSLALHAGEYLVSYRYVVKDMILFNDSLQVSHAMKKCSGTPDKSIEFIDNDSENLNEILKNNSFEFTNFIHTLGLEVNHKETTINAQNSSTTILTLKTTCFKVDFNDNFARITALK
ncbi:MAG: hypothetical protein H8E76_00445 [Helicobacteraceae bacterium]|nr:hypothetical protein [Candidatus Sulfurimonas ponti]